MAKGSVPMMVEENLKPDKTRRFMDNAFRDGLL
jgi:hypothetical protein